MFTRVDGSGRPQHCCWAVRQSRAVPCRPRPSRTGAPARRTTASTTTSTGACNAHDRCYDTQPYGGGEAGRLACDQEFRAELWLSCSRRFGSTYGAVVCARTAELYYDGVRRFGGSHFPPTPAPKPKPRPPIPRVEVGPLEPVHDAGGNSSGGVVGGSGGSAGGSGGTVILGPPVQLDDE